MKKLLMGAIAAAALAAGCGGDMKSRLAAEGEFGKQVMHAFRSDSALAARMTDNLLESGVRSVVIERLFANGDAAQQVMLATARDRTRLDGVIALAVQDSGTRGHVLALLKGIEIGDAAR